MSACLSGGGAGLDSRRPVGLLALMLCDRIRAAVERGKVDEAADLFTEDAVFRSRVLFKPYEGRDQVVNVKVLRAAERVLGRAVGSATFTNLRIRTIVSRCSSSQPWWRGRNWRGSTKGRLTAAA